MNILNVALFSVPYSEDDRHQPLHKQPPDWPAIVNVTGLNQKIDNFGKSIKIGVPYDLIQCANYAMFLIQFDNQQPTQWYAWIDEIRPLSYQNTGSCDIIYHWDYWRTFKDDINILRGTISNRAESTDDPPQNPPSVKYFYSNTLHDIHNQYKGLVWIFLSVIQDKENKIIRYTFPVWSFYTATNIKMTLPPKNGVCPSLLQVLNSEIFSMLNLRESKIIGLSVTSIAPFAIKDITRDNDGNITEIELINENSKDITFKVPAYDIRKHEQYKRGAIYSDDDKFNFIYNWEPTTAQFIKVFNCSCYPLKDVNEWQLTLKVPNTQYFPILLRILHYTKYSKNTEFRFPEGTVFKNKLPSNWERDDQFSHTFSQKYDIDTTKSIIKAVPHELTASPVENYRDVDVTYSDGTKETIFMHQILVERDPTDENKEYDIYTTSDAINVYDIEKVTYKEKEYSFISCNTGIWPEIQHTLNTPIKSTPTDKVVLSDNNGYPINTFIQGHELRNYTTQCISLNNIMYTLIMFNSDHGYVEGNEFAVPMTTIDILQTYYNEYILSGERELANSRRVENIMSSLANIAGSAVMGSLLRGPAGGIMGGVMGFSKSMIAAGMTSGVLQYAIGQYQQGEEEKRLQTLGSKLITSGDDYSWVYNGYNVALISCKIDGYSENLWNSYKTEYGITCEEIDRYGIKINNLLNTEGPLCLKNVVINSNIPIDAIEYIKNKLFSGVYIDGALSK